MRTQLYSIPGLPTGQLSIMARPRGGDWLIDEIKALRESDVNVLVSLLTPAEMVDFDLAEEALCCQTQGIIYISFPIPDRGVPPFSAQTSTFLEQLRAYLSEGKHIALHCRQGLGRAPLVAASVLVFNDIAPELAFDLLSKTRGYPVPETEEQVRWVQELARRFERGEQTGEA